MKKILISTIILTVFFIAPFAQAYGGAGAGMLFFPLKTDNKQTILSHTVDLTDKTSYSFTCDKTITKGLIVGEHYSVLYQCPENYPLQHLNINFKEKEIKIEEPKKIITASIYNTKNTFRGENVIQAGYIKTTDIKNMQTDILLKNSENINIFTSKDFRYWKKGSFIIENNIAHIDLGTKDKFFIITKQKED